MNKIIQELEAAQMKRDVPEFKAGDTVIVKVEVKEDEHLLTPNQVAPHTGLTGRAEI